MENLFWFRNSRLKQIPTAHTALWFDGWQYDMSISCALIKVLSVSQIRAAKLFFDSFCWIFNLNLYFIRFNYLFELKSIFPFLGKWDFSSSFHLHRYWMKNVTAQKVGIISITNTCQSTITSKTMLQSTACVFCKITTK